MHPYNPPLANLIRNTFLCRSLQKTYLLHIATMCLAAVAQRKLVTICHLSSSSRHFKKVQRAGRQSSSFTVESSGVTRKKKFAFIVHAQGTVRWKKVHSIKTHPIMEITWTYVQGPSWQSVYFKLILTDRNMQVRYFWRYLYIPEIREFEFHQTSFPNIIFQNSKRNPTLF